MGGVVKPDPDASAPPVPAPTTWLDEVLPDGGDGPFRDGVRGYLTAAIHAYGRTPVVTLDTDVAGTPRTLLLKLEGCSPWQSLKGRTAMGLLAASTPRVHERRPTIIESTSGNLGVALASMCGHLGWRFIAVVDRRLPSSIREHLTALGAEIEPVDPPGGSVHGLCARIDRVRQLERSVPDAVWTNQYGNRVNPTVHAGWNGPELYRKTSGAPLDTVLAAVSSGGAYAGTARHFRRFRPDTAVIPVDVTGSSALGGVPACRLLTGIGASRRSTFVTPYQAGAARYVTGPRAIGACHAVLRDTGLRLGGSSGALVAAAIDLFQARPAVRSVAALCPDLGNNYHETIYDDRWLGRHLGIRGDDLADRFTTDGATVRFRLRPRLAARGESDP